MKLTLLQYLGQNVNGYLFQDKNELTFLFSKCRKELVENFKLDKKDNINKWYKVHYFQVKPLNRYDLINPDFIISNLEIELTDNKLIT